MSKFHMDMNNFRKIKSDKLTTTLRHVKDGHEIRLSHKSLSPDIRSQLDSLPVHKFADGGFSDDNSSGLKSSDDIAADEAAENTPPQNEVGGVAYTGPEIHDDPTPPVSPPTQEKKGKDRSPSTSGMEDMKNGFEQLDENLKSDAPPPAQINNQNPQQPSLSYQNQDPYGLGGYQSQLNAIGEQKTGQQMMAAAQGAEGNKVAQAELQNQADIKSNADRFNDAWNEFKTERENLQKDIANSHVDPKRYVENMSTGKKISTALGLILGGIGSGLTHGPNMAANFLQKQIDNDMEAQRVELGKKDNLLSHNLRATGDMMTASGITRMQTNDILSSRLKQIAGETQNQASKGMALNVAGQLDAQTAQVQQQMALRKMQMGGGGGNGQDPARLVPLLVPKEHQAKAFSEIEAAQNTSSNAPGILQSFDKAAKNIHGADFVPGMQNVDQKSLHTLLGPTFKDVEGTVRQAAMDNLFGNVTPQFGDDANTTQTKRNALLGYLNSKMSAPTARGYGIDLSKFPMTSGANAGPEIKTMGGVKYQKVPGGWKKLG